MSKRICNVKFINVHNNVLGFKLALHFIVHKSRTPVDIAKAFNKREYIGVHDCIPVLSVSIFSVVSSLKAFSRIKFMNNFCILGAMVLELC